MLSNDLFFHSLIKTISAKRLIAFGFTQHYQLIVGNGPVRNMGQLTATHTYGMYFRNIFGRGKELGHGSKTKYSKIL